MNALEFANRLRQVAPAIEQASYEEPLRWSVGNFRGAVAEIFERQVDSDGMPWAPRKGNPPNPPLILTGAMYDSATGQGATIDEIGLKHAKAGVSPEIFYAAFHQYGTVRMPAREFFYLPKRHLPAVRLPIANGFKRILIRVMRGEWTSG